MPERLVKWRPGSVRSGGLGWPVPCSVPQFCRGKEMNNLTGSFSCLRAGGMAVRCSKHSTERVESNLQVKLEIAEGKVSEMKQTGLWNKSVWEA